MARFARSPVSNKLPTFGFRFVDKAIKTITKIEWAQVIHYLRATRIPYAMLVNFGRPSIQYDTFDLNKLPSSSVLGGMDTAAKPPTKTNMGD